MSTRSGTVRIGLVGYGAGGRRFHAPFIDAAAGVELAGVVVRSPERRAELAADYPGLPAFATQAELLASGIDAVVITTPPATRQALVLEAIEAGVAIVADKPFAPDATIARQLERAASDAGVLLNAYHNRRRDADIRTLRAVLDSGELGELRSFESRFDLFEPHTIEAGPGGGVLSDLGSHLIDQAIWLFGPVAQVYAELDMIDTPTGSVDSGFFVSLLHRSGVRSHLQCNKLGRAVGRELRVTGTSGSYRSAGTDVQADAISAGLRPDDDPAGWGREAPEHWGTLTNESGNRPVPSEQGSWQSYYEQFAQAVRGEAASPVPAEQAVAVITVIDAARISATQSRVVAL